MRLYDSNIIRTAFWSHHFCTRTGAFSACQDGWGEGREVFAGVWAKTDIKNLTREVVAGEVFQGKVVKIMDFGAFVEILPGQDGLVHISELSQTRVEKVEDVVKIGDVIAVKVKEIDSQGRINLTHKGV